MKRLRQSGSEMKRTKEPPKVDPFACYQFNIKCEGDIVSNRVDASYFRAFRPEVITWAWCMNVRRELTRDEIKKLCKA
jgi:hypothetical protein